MRIDALAAAILIGAGLGAASHGASAEPRIGSAAIVSQDVSGTLGHSHRTLKRGDGVFQNETVATGNGSRAQLLFNDETALNMGANSKVVLDKLVYDPDKKTGEVTLRAVSGAFRFVSGSAPKGAYTIKTPAGTIGVRGTIIQFTIIGNVVTLSLIEGGTTFCITPSQCTDLNKPGTYVVVTGDQVSAQEVLNALGCGATACNDTSYKQGDQTTYIIYFSDDKVRPISFTPPVEEEHHHHHHHWWFFGWFHHHHHHHHHHHYPWWSFIWFHHHHHYWWSYHWFHHHHHHWWFYSWFHHHHHHHYRRHHHWHFAYYYNRFHHHHHHRHHHHRRDAR